MNIYLIQLEINIYLIQLEMNIKLVQLEMNYKLIGIENRFLFDFGSGILYIWNELKENIRNEYQVNSSWKWTETNVKT